MTCPRCRGVGQVDVRWFGLVRCGLCAGTGQADPESKPRVPVRRTGPTSQRPDAEAGPDLFAE